MDVTFTNVLEGARQYFQGLPTGTSSTVGPPYSTEGHRRNDHEQNPEMPPSSNSYWPAQPNEPARSSTREHTPVQRSSESARSSSHTQYNPNEQGRMLYPGAYPDQFTTVQQQQHQPPLQQQSQQHQQQSQQQPHQQQQLQQQHPQPQNQQQRQLQHPQPQPQQSQSFQFSRPQSREAPSNHPQYQSHIPTSSPYYQVPSPYHHQTPSPQLPRAPSREQLVPRVPSREQQTVPRVPSREQLIPRTPSREQINPLSSYPVSSENYINYSQSQPYYSVQSQSHTKSTVSDNTYKTPTSSQSYPNVSQQQNVYYKQIYSSHSQMSQQNVYSNSRPNIPQIADITRQQQHQSNHSTNISNDNAEQGEIRTTHNLPPIAALSNYHSSRSVREPTRLPVSNSRTRQLSSSSYTTNTSQQNLAVTSNSSIIQTNPTRSLPNASSSSSSYHPSYHTYATKPQQHHSQYQYPVTVTTQNYTNVIMTTSTSNSNYYPLSSQTSQSSSRVNYQPTMSNITNNSRNLSSTNQQPPQNSHAQNLNGKSIIKKESPLDLSVKTVRTPADSTLGDTENEARNKYYINRTAYSSISTHNYPQLDVNSFGRNITHSSGQSATAPKVEFRPNFNVPSLTQPSKQIKRPVEDPKRNIVPEKAHSSGRAVYNSKNVSYPLNSTNRYPTGSIPSAAHVNSYIQAQEVTPKNRQPPNVPRMNFPPGNHKTNSVYAVASHDPQKKRAADVAPLIVPNKIQKLDSWRESIDLQIEERLLNYKQQQQQQTKLSKPSVINGSYTSISQDKSKDIYSIYQKPNYENVAPHASYAQTQSHYHIQSNHSQTYVPSPATPQYPGYAGITNQQPQTPNTSCLNVTSRSKSNAGTLPNTKNHLSGANQTVIHLLKHSLENKGQKKLFEQLKSQESYTQHPRSDIQHPSTDVTAPLQPKPGVIGRNNVSPFTPTSFPDNNTMASIYNKFHIPRAIDSVNFEINRNQNHVTERQILDTVIANHNSPNSDCDGLAAFLAARIRTKGELKQGGPTNQNVTNNNSSISESRLQGIIENQLNSPMKQDTSQSSAYCASSGTTTSSSPSKQSKERQTTFAPRKRLFSRNEEDPSGNVPPRDKSGLRSSSETSVFDFPDSDSETDMNGRESLEAMRKGRKSSLKPATPINSIEIKTESPGPASPGDDVFSKLCDNFVESLKNGAGKKKVKRKKPLEPEVLAKLETFPKEKPLDKDVKVEIMQIKEENKESDKLDNTSEVFMTIKDKEENRDVPSFVEPKIVSTPESEIKQYKSTSKSSTDTDIGVKKEDPIFVSNKETVRRRLVSSSDSSDSEKEAKQNKDKGDINSYNIPKISEEKKECKDDQKEKDSPRKSNEILPIIRPAKKPSFGDGSNFYPGWEEGVYKYKKSLRMPPTLIQVTRPPQFHRLSTSLPDLDPCPQSPTTSIVADNEKESPSKSKLKKIKSEPIDSDDNESNSSLNLFNKKINYDSEDSASIRSLPNTAKEMSILDKLLEKYGGRRKRKIKRKEDHSPKIIPKSENSIELLPTPGLEIKQESGKEVKKLAAPVIKSESALLGFRKKTINNFKDAFIKNANNIVGLNEQFATVVLKSRTRKETRVLKQRATIKEVFGEDRPASAPPVTCVNDIQIKEEPTEVEENSCLGNLIVKLEKQNDIIEKQSEVEKKVDKENEVADTKQVLKNKLLNKGKKKEKNSLLKNIADRKIKMEIQDEIEDETRSLDDIIIKRDPDDKSETPSIDGDDGSFSGRKRGKFGKMRRKLSSGFDYIRKKKKVKKEVVENDTGEKKKRKNLISKTLESVDDIQKEIKTWVLNKGIGETHLHRSARLGYTDVTAYCLEKMECQPSPKDNAGYTPLHEACSRGHLHIAKLLLLYGANASESAQGGIRPLHEAVENGFVEIARLLLSYGADPTLATYSGLTPLALTNDEITKEFLKNHLNDIEGEPSPAWIAYGPASFFDPVDDIGYNILDDIPNADPETEEEDIEFEMSESLLPNLYTLRGESPSDRWILLQDLSNLLKIKSRDALLRQICPPSTSSANVNFKSVLRELKMSDFLEQAHCCQFLNAGEKINTRASKIALVKYTDKVKELLNIESVMITTR